MDQLLIFSLSKGGRIFSNSMSTGRASCKLYILKGKKLLGALEREKKVAPLISGVFLCITMDFSNQFCVFEIAMVLLGRK